MKTQYKTGDVVFMQTGTLLGRIIRKIAGIKYNHTGIVLVIGGYTFIAEAIWGGVEIRLFDKSIKKASHYKIVRPTRKIKTGEYIYEALRIAGFAKYDIFGLIWHQLVWNLLGIWIGRSEKKAHKSFYCYEFSAYMNMIDYPEWWKVKPKEFANDSWHKTVKEK